QPVGVAGGVEGGGVEELLLGGDVEGVVAAGADDGPGPGVPAELVEGVAGLVGCGAGQDEGLHVGDAVAPEPFHGEVLLGGGAPGGRAGAGGDHGVRFQQGLERGEFTAAVRRDLVQDDDVGGEVDAFGGDVEP